MPTLRELMDLRGRVALVAGAGHIGSTAARTFAEMGAAVAVADIDEAAARRTAGGFDGEALALPTDLSDEDATRETVRRCVAWRGRLDILVHAAGMIGSATDAGWAAPFEQQSLAAWRKAMAVNLESAFVLCQQAAPALRTSGAGAIILVSSIYGSVGPEPGIYAGTDMHNPVGYGASKGGLLQLMRYLATLLAPEIRVNAISPGGVARGQPEPFTQRYNERVPLRRMATEDDLRGAFSYLGSRLSAYVTGHDLVVDGGWTAR